MGYLIDIINKFWNKPEVNNMVSKYKPDEIDNLLKRLKFSSIRYPCPVEKPIEDGKPARRRIIITQLKPCPFCGSDQIIINKYVSTYHVECGKCEASITPCNDKQSIIDLWNTRASTWHKWPAENLEPGRYLVVCDECPVPIVGYYEWDVSGWVDYEEDVITVTLYTSLPAHPEDK